MERVQRAVRYDTANHQDYYQIGGRLAAFWRVVAGGRQDDVLSYVTGSQVVMITANAVPLWLLCSESVTVSVLCSLPV